MNKNKMPYLRVKYFGNACLILTIGIFVLISWVNCHGQVNQKESTPSNSNVTTKANEVARYLEEPTDSVLLVDNSEILNQYKDSKKDGLWREYYKNGYLKSENNYKEGMKEGLCKEWWETGKLWTEGIYVNDKANGLMKWHNDEGVLVAYGNMTDDKRDGKWKICDIHNTLNCIEANFKDDKKIGIWKILHDNGELWKEQKWNDGKMESEKCWDVNGIEIECK